ncbi:MAG: pilus assembly protein PilM, partial [Planctomycetota bacterium]
MQGGRFSSTIGAVGIDFGTRTIKMLQVREAGDDLRVVGAARIEAPGDGLTPRPDQISSAFSAGGFTGRKCVVSLPREDVHVQSIRMPRMPDREVRQAVAWEAAQRFELDRDTTQVDFLQTGASVHGSEDREETLLIAATDETITKRLEPLLAAGLQPIAIDTAFAALARAMSHAVRRDADQLSVRAVVEIGAAGSSVMILQGPNVRFYKALSVRGIDLNDAVVQHLQIDAESAAELRIARIGASDDANGPMLDASTDRAVYEAVRPRLNELVKEVVLCLRYYGVT